MGSSPVYHPHKGEEFETSVEHGLPLWAEPTVGYSSRRPRPSPMWASCFVGARAVGPWVGEQKPLGKTPLRGNPSPEMTYLPTLPRLPFVRLTTPAPPATLKAPKASSSLHKRTTRASSSATFKNLLKRPYRSSHADSHFKSPRAIAASTCWSPKASERVEASRSLPASTCTRGSFFSATKESTKSISGRR